MKFLRIPSDPAQEPELICADITPEAAGRWRRSCEDHTHDDTFLLIDDDGNAYYYADVAEGGFGWVRCKGQKSDPFLVDEGLGDQWVSWPTTPPPSVIDTL
jgi:hypothetical protein